MRLHQAIKVYILIHELMGYELLNLLMNTWVKGLCLDVGMYV